MYIQLNIHTPGSLPKVVPIDYSLESTSTIKVGDYITYVTSNNSILESHNINHTYRVINREFDLNNDILKLHVVIDQVPRLGMEIND